jgi:hypothetical protein
MQKALGERARGRSLGRGFLGGPQKTPREWTLVHWYPPGGGGGPKKRHLVLSKLAGFCTADRGGCGAFFRLLSSTVVYEFLSKMCKMCTFWHIFGPKTPIFPLFCPLFCTSLPEIPRGGGGDPFVGGPPGGGRRRARAEPPPGRGARRARGGGTKKFQKIF